MRDALLTLAAAKPTVSFDLVHAELSLDELIAAFRGGFDLLYKAFCALPFVKFC